MHSGATDFPTVSCARCGERLYMPETSELSEADTVRHRWKCTPCGHLFETTVALGAPRGRRRSDRQQAFSDTRQSW